jgi:hypothetical protein
VTAAALPLPAGAATEATLGGVLTTANFQARINTLGAKTSANSTPVVIASDQSTVPVSLASLPIPTGAFQIPLVASEEPVRNMQLSFPYNINAEQVNSTVANGGTITQSNSKAVLQTSANAAGSAILTSRGAARYTPGQGQVAKFTAIFESTAAVDKIQEVGLGDLTDGFFFAVISGGFCIVRRRGGVNVEVITQANFNGTIPGGFTPYAVGQVYAIRYQWLGFGDVYFFIEDPLLGSFSLVHTIRYPGTSAVPSIFNPSLPLFARVVNAGTATNTTLQVASMGVFSEGPFNDYGLRWATGNRKAGVTTQTSIFAIRNNATVFGGATNRSNVHLDLVSVALSGGADSQIRGVLNATLGGVPAFTDISTNSSLVSVDVAGTTVTGGRELFRFPSTGNASQVQDLSNLNIILRPGDTLTMAGVSFGAAVAFNGGFGWTEEI